VQRRTRGRSPRERGDEIAHEPRSPTYIRSIEDRTSVRTIRTVAYANARKTSPESSRGIATARLSIKFVSDRVKSDGSVVIARTTAAGGEKVTGSEGLAVPQRPSSTTARQAQRL